MIYYIYVNSFLNSPLFMKKSPGPTPGILDNDDIPQYL